MAQSGRTRTLEVRGLDPYVLEKLSRLAAGSGLSRNEYVKRLLTAAAESPAETDRVSREEKLMESVVDVLTETVQTLSEVREQLNQTGPDRSES